MDPRPPSVTVHGSAEREVVPDEVTVVISIVTPVLPTAAEALAEGVTRRRAVRDLLAAEAPDAGLTDARVTTTPEYVQVRDRDAYGETTTRSEIRGHRGVCEVRARAAAGRAAALVALVGTHPAVSRARPAFAIGRDLARATDRELEQDAVRDGLARAEALAVAAGMRPGGVLEIAPPAVVRDESYDDGMVAYSAISMSKSADVEDALGEIAPEPLLRSATVAVTVALRPASG